MTRRWLKPLIVAVPLVLAGLGFWAWSSFLWVFFVKPGDGGPRLQAKAEAVAGSPSGQAGFRDGTGTEALMNKPIRLARLDGATVVFADINNHAIRTVDTAGRVRTLAGGPGKAGHQDGPAATARFKSPHGVAVRSDGAIAVAEVGNDTIRLLVPGPDGAWAVRTLAGVPGHSGMKDGPCAQARFSSPHAVAWGKRGELYVADIGNARIRKVEDGQVTTVAGDGHKGWLEGSPGRLSWPMDLAMDADGTLWIADCGTLTLRTWSPAAGLGTPFPGLRMAMPHGLSVQDGKVYVAEMNGQRILVFDRQTGAVATLYGTGARGFAPGQLNRPAAVLAEGPRLWVADLYNHRLITLER